jgi:hypothetical protein
MLLTDVSSSDNEKINVRISDEAQENGATKDNGALL